MEITPELIAEYEFSSAIRGYDEDQVDEFLEHVGSELARTQQQLRIANDRISSLETELEQTRVRAQQAAMPPQEAEADARRAARALLAAQETAERIERDATTEADRTIAAAQADATTIRSTAHSEAERLRTATDAETTRLRETALAEAEELRAGRIAELDGEVADREERSGALQRDVTALEGRIEHYRGLLESLATMLRNLLDDPDALHAQPAVVLDAPVAAHPQAAPAVPLAGGDWSTGTWAASVAPATDPFGTSGEFPMGAPTTEVDAVDVGADVADAPVATPVDETVVLTSPVSESPDDAPSTDRWSNAAVDRFEPTAEADALDLEPVSAAADAAQSPALSGDADPSAAPADRQISLAYTAEFDALDMEIYSDDGEAPAAAPADSAPRHSLSDDDVFQTAPYVPKRVLSDEEHGDDFDVPPVDLAGDSHFDDRYELDDRSDDLLGHAEVSHDPFGRSDRNGGTYSPETTFDGTRFDDDRLSDLDRLDDFDHSSDFSSVDAGFEFVELPGGSSSGVGEQSTFFGGHDRYLQELDEAVNGGGADESSDLDDFMSSPGDGGDFDSSRRRFRRNR